MRSMRSMRLVVPMSVFGGKTWRGRGANAGVRKAEGGTEGARVYFEGVEGRGGRESCDSVGHLGGGRDGTIGGHGHLRGVGVKSRAAA